MYQTLRFFTRSNNFKDLEQISIDEIVRRFKNAKDNNVRGKCMSAIYIKLFPMIIKIQRSFPTLTMEQKVDACLLVLQSNLERYKIGDKTKFTSYFYGNLQRFFITVQNKEKCHKRSVWQHMVEPKDVKTKDYLFDINKSTTNKPAESRLFQTDIMRSPNLTYNEKIMCLKLLEGYKTNKELIGKIPIDATLPEDKVYSIICDIRRNLKKKVQVNGKVRTLNF